MKKPLLSEMTLREKIGQMLAPMHFDVYGKPEMTYDYSQSNMDEVKALYAKEQFGVIRGEQVGVFFADPENGGKPEMIEDRDEGLRLANCKIKVEAAPYKKFIEKHNTYGKVPMLVGGDFSVGGSYYFSDSSLMVNANAIAAADSEELTFQLGAAIARQMRCTGHNWKWSPPVDMTNRNNTHCMRTFSIDDPELTIKHSKAYIDGIQSEGVAACVKHFPSVSSDEARDGHLSCQINNDSMEKWWSVQGRVYKEILDAGVYSVMTTHAAFPAADDRMINGRYVPATLSKKILTDLLKGELGFKGVVSTDGIGMANLFTILPYEELVIEMVNAGNDIILGAKLPTGDIIEAAVKDGRISEERIDDACQRILDMKEKIGLFDESYYDLPYTMAEAVADTDRISAEIAKRSITVIRDNNKLLPLDKKNIKKVSVIISTHADGFVNEIEELKKAFNERGIEVFMKRRLDNGFELEAIAENSDLIIYAVDVHQHGPAGYLRLFGDEAYTYYHAFKFGKEKSLGVSFGYPYIHYDIMEGAPTFINAYNPRKETMEAFVAAILGEIPIVGKSPLSIIPKANTR